MAAGVVVGLAGVAAVAGAQTGGSTGNPPVTADAQIGFERHVDLTPQQQVAQAEMLVNQMSATAGTTQRMLKEARLARDVVRILCLNDKLSQVDVTNQSASERMKSLKAAVARGDRELGNHEFTIMSVLSKRSSQLSAEANQCIGQEAAFTGATNVVTTVDVSLPTDPGIFTDPSGVPIPATIEPCTAGSFCDYGSWTSPAITASTGTSG